MSERIIQRDKSLVVAADVEASKLSGLVQKTCLVEGIGGYKVGLALALEEGLPRIVGQIKDKTELPVIYDHQKAGNDIPAMGVEFAKVCRKAGVDAVILFPFGGAKTERDWIHAAYDQGLGVLVGAHMTQPEFLQSEGGYVANDAPEKIFRIAAHEGVKDFVVPGNKLEYVQKYADLFATMLGPGNFTLYSPGFLTQGGEISEFAKAAGDRWHAIVGRAIYEAVNIHDAAERLTKQIR